MASVAELVGKLESSDQKERYKAKRGLEQLTAREPRATAQALAAELSATREVKDGNRVRKEPARSATTRSALCRYLSQVAGDTEVPVLVAALNDLEVREMARWALARVPGDASTVALCDAVKTQVGPEFRIGCVTALAGRSNPVALATLKGLVQDPTLEVRLAAAEVLAQFADPTLDASIASAAAIGPGDFSRRDWNRVIKARIIHAEALAKANQRDAAKKVLQAVLYSRPDAPQQQAAEKALRELG